MGDNKNPTDDSIFKALRAIPPACLLDVLSPLGYTKLFMKGVKSFSKNEKLIGRAVTLRFIPTRVDLKEENFFRPGIGSKRSEAIELCGPGDVLVIDGMGEVELTVGGDIKFLRLKQRGAEGLVTDAAIRDTAELLSYGMKIFAANNSGSDGDLEMLPWGVNEVISCGGVSVKPGDYIIGDDDGVVVVPKNLVQEAIKLSADHLRMEDAVKKQLEIEDVPVGKYYPWKDATAEIMGD
jgi:5-oxopent-3-ene-1,2,5-tricarboxylate decarboxylase/2-hydroxyhepta-2,4-diene-1,7-dioate isomerase